MSERYDIYLSACVAEEDKPFCEGLVKWLEGHSVDGRPLEVFTEDKILPGDYILQALAKNLVDASHILLVMTPESVAEEWMDLESAAALKAQGRLISLVLHAAPLPTFLDGIAQVQVPASGTDGRWAERLREALKIYPKPGAVPSPIPTPAAPAVPDAIWTKLVGLYSRVFGGDMGSYPLKERLASLGSPDEKDVLKQLDSARRANRYLTRLGPRGNRGEQVLGDLVHWNTFLSKDRAYEEVKKGIEDFLAPPPPPPPPPKQTQDETATGPRQAPRPFIPKAWAEYLETSYGHLEPLLNTEKPRRPRIEALYVSLSTSWQSPKELKAREESRKQGQGGGSERAATRGQESVRRPLADLLTHAEVQHFLLEGVPGGGKSTFARHAALTALPKDTLPIYLELKNFGAWLGRHPHAEGASALLDWAGEALADLGLSRAGLEARLGFGRTLWLLDGLDEIFQKELLLRAAHALGCFAASVALAGERLVILSRPHALQDPEILAELRLKEGRGDVALLSDEEQLEFIRRWFDALYGPEEVNRETRIKDEADALAQALEQHPYLAELRQTPLHLGLMASLYFHGKKLPDRRAELFDRAIDWLLNRSFGPRAPRGSEEKVLGLRVALSVVARGMMELGAVRELGELDFRGLLREGWCPTCRHDSPQLLELSKLCHELGSHSGLVRVAGFPPVYRFAHLSFQEYLAAWSLGNEDDPIRAVSSRLDEGGWKETILLTAGYLGMDRHPRRCQKYVEGLRDRRGDPPGHCRRLALVVQSVCEAPRGLLPQSLKDELRALAVEAITDAAQPCPVNDRMELGLALGRLGDPRLGLEKPERWVWVPPGKFRMGSKHGDSDEKPIHTVKISRGFWLGKYPVTNQEYAAFVKAGGYEAQEWWDEAGWKLVQEESLREPRLWRDPTWNGPNQPMVGVSWYEAAAFCRWLKGTWKDSRPSWLKADLEPRLPSEAEWELSARGPEGREYPWGNEEPTPERANYGDTGLERTSPVGIFPAGASPTGLLDMAGNVYEWCADHHHSSYQGAPTDGSPWIDNKQNDVDSIRVLRGGCWIISADGLRAACRFRLGARGWDRFWGFRVVLSAVPGGSSGTLPLDH